MTIEPQSMLDIALDLAAKNFRVFPLIEGGKKPREKGWTRTATSDPEEIERLWRDPVTNWVQSWNVGVLTDAQIVLDIDVKDGRKGFESAAALGILDDVLDTFTVRTPSGGLHAYFSGPNRSLSAGKLGEGLDVRSFHGFVVAPGSVTPQGRYEIENDVPIKRVPAALLERLDAPRERQETAPAVELDLETSIAAAVEFLKWKPGAKAGQLNDECYKTAATTKDYGVSEARAVDLIVEHWAERCEPPIPPADVPQIVANAYTYGTRQPGSLAPAAEFAGIKVEPPIAENVLTPAKGRPVDRFRLERFSALKVATESSYLIKGVLPPEGLAVLWGTPKAGKTFFTLDMMVHVALGRTFYGHKVKRGVVIYCAFEGKKNFGSRVEAIRQYRLEGDDGAKLDETFRLMLQPMKLVEDKDAFVEAIRAQLDEATPPACIVLDTLNKSFSGNENDTADMSRYLDAADHLREAFGCLVLIVHHPGHNTSRKRGNSTVDGRLDVDIRVEKLNRDIAEAEIMEARDGSAGEKFRFRRATVNVGVDAEGDPITSCVVSQADAPEGSDGVSLFRRIFNEQAKLCAVTVTPYTHAGIPWAGHKDEFVSLYQEAHGVKKTSAEQEHNRARAILEGVGEIIVEGSTKKGGKAHIVPSKAPTL